MVSMLYNQFDFVIIIKKVYVYLTPPHERMGHLVNFLKEFNRFEIRVFLLLDRYYTKVKEPSLPQYCSHCRKENACLSLGYKCYVKSKLSRPGFELGSPCPFPTTINATPPCLTRFYLVEST